MNDFVSGTNTDVVPPDGSGTFPPEPTAVRAARQFVAERLGAAPVDHQLVALVVSELASNAVLHAGTPFVVTAEQLDGSVRVEVSDTSPDRPREIAFDPSAITGRGMMIVASAADRWGVDQRPDGKTVWFEIDANPPAVERVVDHEDDGATREPPSGRSDLLPDGWRVDTDGALTTIAVTGPLDLVSAPSLREALTDPTAPPDTLLVDLAACDFIDSVGISVIAAALARATGDGIVLRFRLSDATRRVLTLSGLLPRMELVDG